MKGKHCVYSVAGTFSSVTESLLNGQFGPGPGNIEIKKMTVLSFAGGADKLVI